MMNDHLADTFRPKSSFNPRNKYVIIETYLSCLEERLLDNKFLLIDLTILQRKNGRLCIIYKMTVALSSKVLTRVLSSLFGTERII